MISTVIVSVLVLPVYDLGAGARKNYRVAVVCV